MNDEQIFVWLDMEMTGLNPENCVIVQMAMILTDSHLNELAEPLEITIWQPDAVLTHMIPYVRRMHENSGLLEQIRRSTTSVEEAEHQAMEILSRHATYRTARLCGNSISQDRRFMYKYMPSFESYLHYRHIDVSTLKELAERWYGLKFKKPNEGKHTALHDVRQSIAELKYYREHMFQSFGA